MQRRILRQGDVILYPLESVPADLRGVGDVLEVHGEHGHTHRLDSVYVFETAAAVSGARPGPGVVVIVEGDVHTMTHEEHLPLVVPQGVYAVRQMRSLRRQRHGD